MANEIPNTPKTAGVMPVRNAGIPMKGYTVMIRNIALKDITRATGTANTGLEIMALKK